MEKPRFNRLDGKDSSPIRRNPVILDDVAKYAASCASRGDGMPNRKVGLTFMPTELLSLAREEFIT